MKPEVSCAIISGIISHAISNLPDLAKVEFYKKNVHRSALELRILTLLSEFDISMNLLAGMLSKDLGNIKKPKIFHLQPMVAGILVQEST